MFLTLIDGPELLIKVFTPLKLKYVFQPNTTPLFPEFPVKVLREKNNVRGIINNHYIILDIKSGQFTS